MALRLDPALDWSLSLISGGRVLTALADRCASDCAPALSFVSSLGHTVERLTGPPLHQIEVMAATLQPWPESGPPADVGLVFVQGMSGVTETEACAIHECFIRILEARLPVVVVDWPDRCEFGHLYPAVERAYARAASIDYRQLTRANVTLAQRLGGLTRAVIRCPKGTELMFTSEPGSVTMEHCRLSPTETLVQIPGGEVFLRPAPGSAEGVAHVEVLGRSVILEIVRGRVQLPPDVRLDIGSAELVEVGLGSNPAAPPSSFLTLGEKSRRAVHLGVGDGRIVGGRHADHIHVDLLITDGVVRGAA